MITAIEIENLRGIRTGRLEGLAPLTILTGPNGCGKSTVLDALLIGASLNTGEALIRAVQRHPVSLAGADWLFRNPDAPLVLRVVDDAGKNWAYTLRRTRNLAKEINVDVSGTTAKSFFKQVVVSFDSENQGAFKNARMLGMAKSIGTPVRLVDPGIAIPLHELFSAAIRVLRREEIDALLREIVADSKGLLILTEGDKPFLALSTPTAVAPVSLAGDGIQALVQTALEVATTPDGLVLIEEPEVYQHPRAIWQTAKVLLANVRRGVQIVLTTHSLELIDALIAQATEQDLAGMAVFNLLLEAGELRYGRRLGEEITFARQTLENDLR